MSQIKFLSTRKSEIFPDQWYSLARDDHFWMQWRLQAFLRQLKDLNVDLNSPCSVLEIGCGDGALRQQLEKISSWSIDGADINDAALKNTPNVRGKTFFYDIFDKYQDFAGHYDIIILFDVLEHIKDEAPFIDAVKFHLKKNGKLFINVPALQSLYSRYDEAVGHQRRYDKAMMADVLNSMDLKLMDMRYWGFSMLPLLGIRQLMVKNAPLSAETIRKGFQPPSPMANKMMKLVMRFETSFWKNPLSGSSLLTAVKI